jgi:gluconate 2-dehydrogenase gamma chain
MSTETDETGDKSTNISRRAVFRQIGFAGAAVAVSATPLGCTAESAQTTASAAPRREALETLNATEADALEAIVARLIPSDENGPGATEARAAHYIDRALAGQLHALRSTYAVGLAAIDEHAQSTKGATFARLSPADQDVILRDMEADNAPGFMPSASAFFNLLRTHTIEGTFCDPYYGGNANFVGWDLIRYPGLRMGVTAEDQRMNAQLAPTHTSAYDDPMFTRGGGDHGHQP